MKTLKQQTLPFGEEKSTSSPGDFHASHFQQRVNAKVHPITVTYGRKCCEQFGKLSPDGSWARTFSELLVGTEDWFSSRCTLTWKLKATKSKRLYFQLAVSTRRTSDTEHGLSPMLLKTPSAMDARSENLSKKEQRFGNSGTLAQEVQTGFIYNRGLLPTPRTTDVGRGPVKDVKFENGTYFRENKKGVRFGVNITDVIARWILPTPKANDYRSGMANRVGSGHTQQLNDTMAYHAGKTSQLNPLFVQEMMGFPYLWTELPFQSGGPNQSKPTETR